MNAFGDIHSIKNTRENINQIPTTTGVYIFWQKKEIIYIGKSVNLKARLLSHVEGAKIDAKEAGIVNNADTIKYIITDSEFKALLLESQLINKHKPKYNVRWRDDKSYLYIKVTMKDDFPKFLLARRENDPKAQYYGPFPSVRTATNLLREVRKIFPFCTQRTISKQACFYSKINLCNPCPNNTTKCIDPDEKKRLKRIYRNNIRQVMKVLDGQTDLVLNALYKELKEQSDKEEFEDAIPTRNRIFRLEGLIYGKRLDPDTLSDYNVSQKSVEELNRLLKEFYPGAEEFNRIECYDISNLTQKDATASMVVFNEGLIDRKEYRKFKIKDLNSQSDFEMMDEILKRRFNNKWTRPNLVVVDGGKPQVTVARKVFTEMQIDIPLIGIAKHPDRLVIGTDNMPTIRPHYNNPGFNLIRAIRDESHRFAKKYHVLLRTKKMNI